MSDRSKHYRRLAHGLLIGGLLVSGIGFGQKEHSGPVAKFTQWMMATWKISNPVLDCRVDGNALDVYVNLELARPMRGLTCPEGRKVAESLYKKWSVELGRTASGFTMRDSAGVILLRYRLKTLGLGGIEYHCGMD